MSFTISNAPILASGDKIVVYQATAPIGWTKDTTQNDRCLRVVSGGGGGGSGGSLGIGSANVGNYTLAITDIPSHDHIINPQAFATGTGLGTYAGGGSNFGGNGLTDAAGGGGSHNHPLALAYVDVIIVTKD